MSIASEISALQQDKSDIATALTNKGVTVPSGSGFDSFAGLISSISMGKKAVFLTETLLNTEQYLYYSIDFEPKALFISTSDTALNIQSQLPSISSTNILGVKSYFIFKKNFIEGQNYDMTDFFGVKKSDGTYMERTSAALLRSTYNANTGKWDVILGRADTAKYAYRFAKTVDYDLNIILLGDSK